MEYNNKILKLVIGNGFDLFCGLKTTYKDYFLSREKVLEWSKAFKEYTLDERNFVNFTLRERIKVTYDNIKNYSIDINIFDLYFYWVSTKVVSVNKFNRNVELESDFDINWCDVESIIKQSLTSKKINCDINDDKYTFIIPWDYIYEMRLKEDVCVKESIECYASRFFEVFAALEGIENYQALTKKEFYWHLLHQLNKFEYKFGEYIKEQSESQGYEVLSNVAYKKLISICDCEYALIDSFNYSILDFYNQECFEKDHHTMKNINGNYMNPIFGIDSTKIDSKDEKYIFTKTYRRIDNTTENGFISKYFRKFDYMVIFGHSLNDQDYKYFYALFDSMNILDTNFDGKIVFAYYIYDKNKRKEIINTLIINAISLLSKYEDEKTNNKSHSLVEILQAKDKISFVEITKNGFPKIE